MVADEIVRWIAVIGLALVLPGGAATARRLDPAGDERPAHAPSHQLPDIPAQAKPDPYAEPAEDDSDGGIHDPYDHDPYDDSADPYPTDPQEKVPASEHEEPQQTAPHTPSPSSPETAQPAAPSGGGAASGGGASSGAGAAAPAAEE